MGLRLFNFFRGRTERKIEAALARYEEKPGVDETTEVVELFLKLGDYAAAFEYADNGYQRVPSSPEMLELRQMTLKAMSRAECRELEQQVARRPRPEVIAKIIEIRRSLGEFKACDRLRKRWSRRFRKSWILQFAIGKYLFQRSVVENDIRVSKRCVKHLRLAAAIDPSNYKTLLYLATLLYQIGSLSEAFEIVERLLENHPNDQKALALWECVKNAPDASSRSSQRSEEFNDVAEQLRHDDAVFGALVNHIEDGRIETDYAHFEEDAGFDFSSAETTFDDLCHALTVSTHRMGIGELKTCVLGGEDWQIFYRNHPFRTLLLCTNAEFTEDDFEQVAGELVPEETPA